MAKKHKLVYDRLIDYAKKYQSGFDIEADYNSRFAEVQQELANYLITVVGYNSKAENLLDPLIKSATTGTPTSGKVARPDDFLHLLSGSYEGYPIHILSSNQLATYEQIPQRKGDISKKRVNIASVDGKWEVKPDTATGISIRYVKIPPLSTIAFQISETENEYVMSYDDAATVDFVWGDICVPLIIYMMLEKYGVSMREEILREYARLGISMEEVK
jgi:hypothetical protein